MKTRTYEGQTHHQSDRNDSVRGLADRRLRHATGLVSARQDPGASLPIIQPSQAQSHANRRSIWFGSIGHPGLIPSIVRGNQQGDLIKSLMLADGYVITPAKDHPGRFSARGRLWHWTSRLRMLACYFRGRGLPRGFPSSRIPIWPRPTGLACRQHLS